LARPGPHYQDRYGGPSSRARCGNEAARSTIGEIIIKYNGTLERYAGDGVMVVFNDPVPVENPALQAVLMALEVRDAIGALTETWRCATESFGPTQ
jgi:hypothetical protein